MIQRTDYQFLCQAPESAFCRDILSHEKIPIPGILRKSRNKEKSRIPEIKIPRLKKIPSRSQLWSSPVEKIKVLYQILFLTEVLEIIAPQYFEGIVTRKGRISRFLGREGCVTVTELIIYAST